MVISGSDAKAEPFAARAVIAGASRHTLNAYACNLNDLRTVLKLVIGTEGSMILRELLNEKARPKPRLSNL
jgi:hypothetical protein